MISQLEIQVWAGVALCEALRENLSGLSQLPVNEEKDGHTSFRD